MDMYEIEEAGYMDGEFDAETGNAEYASFGTSVNIDELSDEERDEYEQSYLAGFDAKN